MDKATKFALLSAVQMAFSFNAYGQQQIDLTKQVKGVLPNANGGTGLNALGTGVTNALSVNTGSSGSFVTQNGAITGGNILKWGTGAQDTGIAASALRAILYSGAQALGTVAIASATCATDITVSATLVASTSMVSLVFASNPETVTGYTTLTSGSLRVYAVPGTNQFVIKQCNPTTTSIVPGAISVNAVAY